MRRYWMLSILVSVSLFLSFEGPAEGHKDYEADEWKLAVAASEPLFSDWKEAHLRKLFQEPKADPSGATLWQVTQSGKDLGYIVTSEEGKNLLEYSPVTPVEMLAASPQGTYNYSGPGMHLFRSVNQTEQIWRNLSNGELLPEGTPVEHIPVNVNHNLDPLKERTIPTEVSSDNGLAVMIQHALGQTAPFSQEQLLSTQRAEGYLVFTALPDDYYSVLALTGIRPIHHNTMLEVYDVFAKEGIPLYIRSNVPVNWLGSK